MVNLQRHTLFPIGYRDQVFTLWYSMGKPNGKILLAAMPICEAIGRKPELTTVEHWINNNNDGDYLCFKSRAEPLDAQVMEQINQKMVAEKVEMLNRHASISQNMQEMAITYLEEHKDDLGVGTAVRLLVASIEIERNSRGMATSLKADVMTDEQLNKEIEKLISHQPVGLLPYEGDAVDDVFEDLESADN